MNIEDFLELMEDRDLVPETVVKQVRAKVAKGDRRITPKSLLKYLVQKEFVTKRQAKQLLETTLTVTPKAESSILGMSIMPVPKKPKKVEEPPAEQIPTIEPVIESSDELVTDSISDLTSPVADKPPSLMSESLSKIGIGDPMLTAALEESGLDSDTPQKAKEKKKKKKAKNKNEWDSSLLLLGGGGLALLLVIGTIVFFLLTREDADAVLAEASAFFDGGSYTQAIKQYERFIENHSGHPEYSAGKVKLGLARLWKVSGSVSNSVEALKTAEQVLPDIEDEEEFASAQRDLASLLPEIARGLADLAEKKSDPKEIEMLVAKSNMALALCSNTKYIPKAFRDDIKLDEIKQTLARVQREQEQNTALAKALADMQTTIEDGDTAKAYQTHDQLLDEHPGLINNEQLAAKVLEISNAESAVVKYVAESQTASTDPRPSSVVAELAMANRTGEAVPDIEGTVAVRVSGAIYGLRASDGTLLWRKYVGFAPRLTPIQLPTGDLLVIDDQHHELLKLSGENGKLLWRQPFETSVSRPVLLRDKALVAESVGKLHVIDVASGQRDGYVQFQQRLSTRPAIDSQGRRIYITGDHSSLYTLSTDDFSCLNVFFLNHAKGSVVTPPLNVLNKVIVAVAKGLSTTRLEVLNVTDDGLPTQRVTSHRLNGLVNTAMSSQGRRLVAATSQGQVVIYEVGAGTDKESFTQIASRDAESGNSVARFSLFHKGHIWIAGPKLNRLALLSTSDRLPVDNIDEDYLGDTFDHPLQKNGNLLIHVRRPKDKAGVRVAAMDIKAGTPRWEIELAAPPAGAPAPDSGSLKIGAVTSTGSAYLLDRQAMSRRVLNQAEKSNVRRRLPPLNQSLDLGNGRLVASATKGKTLLHFRPGLPRNALKSISLVGAASCDPELWDDGFVVPTQTGQVFLYNSEDGQPWGSPFQPPLVPGTVYPWLSPATYGSGIDTRLVLSDGLKKVYLLKRATTPQPHLTSTSEVDISTSPLNTRLAVIGDLVLAGTEDGGIAVFELPTLAAKPSTDLQAQITWGPYSVGDRVILATELEELVCLDNQAQILWKKPLEHGPPAGKPITHNGSLTMLWQQGGLSRVEFGDGSETAFVPLPQPVVAGPVPFGKRLMLSSYDGTLLIVEHP